MFKAKNRTKWGTNSDIIKPSGSVEKGKKSATTATAALYVTYITTWLMQDRDQFQEDGEEPHEVVWVDENTVHSCPLCYKDFGFLRPRVIRIWCRQLILVQYHCKRCGRVFCGDCTSNRFMLPNVPKDKLDTMGLHSAHNSQQLQKGFGVPEFVTFATPNSLS